jgi:hypothetical protein
VRQRGAWYRRTRYVGALAVGCVMVAISALPALAATVPGAPPQPTVERGNAQIIVTFSAPSDGGLPILSYSASCTSSNGGASGSNIGVSAALPITVSGLTNGKSYTCTVTASNLLGAGSPSPPSVSVVPAAAPGAPTITSATRGNASISVAFTPGADNGSTITSFSASCTSLDGGAPGTNTNATSPIPVTGLTNAKTYTCTVTATNAVGTSSASLPSLPAIPGAAPDAPTITSVTRGDAAISVAFTPGADNGFTILSYSASCTSSDGGTAGSNTGLSSPISVLLLTNGKTYTCTVTATNAIGTSAPSAASGSVVPAAAPSAPTITSATRGNTSVSVAFTPGADNGSTITSFSASCTSLDGGAPGTDSDTASPVLVTGLTNGKTYTCTVTATNAVGTSSASLPSLPAVPAAVPDPPTITSVTRGNTLISVAFSPGADNGSAITSFAASCTSSNGGTAGSNSGGGSPIDVTGLTNGKTYTCTVTATNGVGTSPASDASATVVPATVPDAPAQPSVARGNEQIVVTFTAPAGNGSAITSYTAACTSSNGGTAGSNSGPASPITVTGLTNGKSYTCTVTATNDVGTGSQSPASASVVPAAVPSAPAQPSLSRGNHQIVVTFTAPADNGSAITSYAASCTSPDGGTAGTKPGAASPITVTGLTNGKTYRCRVTATNAVGTSPSSPSSDPVVPAGVPNPPAIGTATSGDGSASVTFGAPANNGSPITSYSASCTSSNGGAAGSNTGAASPISVTGLTNGKSYTCTVSATNSIGTSAPSAATPAFVPGRPGAPINVRAVSGPAPGATGPLKVSFSPGPDYGSPISSYHVSCTSPNGGAAGSKSGAASPITVTDLTTAKSYRCTVTATSARGTGAPSSAARAVVGAPGTVTVLRTLPLAHGLALPLTRAADNGSPITGYRARCTSSDGGVPGSPLQIDSPVVATGLTDGKTYTCIVTAQNDRGVGPETLTGSVVVGRPNVTYLAACTGSAGSVGANPGLLYSTAKPQTFTLASTMSSCTGPYVSSARISFSFRSSTAINCKNAINVTSGGSGTLFWPSPGGMGKSAATLRFVITSSSGHVTKVHFYGDVQSKANVFTSSHVSGNITLNRGLQTVANGGDCSTSSPLKTFGITSISMKLS